MTLTIDLAAQRYAAELMGKFRGALIAMDVHDARYAAYILRPLTTQTR